MSTPRLASPQRRRASWIWTTPPALTHGREMIDGQEILGEVDGPLAVILWQLARDVGLWAGASAEERVGLFNPREGLVNVGGPVPVELMAPVSALAMAMEDYPGDANPAAVRLACEAVALWALEQDPEKPETALVFYQAASLADPASAQAAWSVAQQALELGYTARAHSQLHRAIGLARQSGEWMVYATAFLELAVMAERNRQEHSQRAAAYYYRRALRSLRRQPGTRELRRQAREGLDRVTASAAPAHAEPPHEGGGDP